MNQNLVEKVTHFLSSEIWDTTTSGVLGSKVPKGATLPASLAQYKAFLWTQSNAQEGVQLQHIFTTA